MNKDALRFEVNFLTIQKKNRNDSIRAIEAEFDFVRMCQGMIKPFGLQAKKLLDGFIALSLRKMLCDEQSMLKAVCPDFKMPPLSGSLFECLGEHGEMQVYETYPDIRVKPLSEWISLDDWLNEKIAWIDKGVDDIPEAYEDSFFQMISSRFGNNSFEQYFVSEIQENSGKKIWRLRETNTKQQVYDLLKSKGYYDLSVKRLIKYIADKRGAHLDASDSIWVNMANESWNIHHSAISVFAIHMIYAATQQIPELKDYLDLNPMLER
jgi:hypothetical protein